MNKRRQTRRRKRENVVGHWLSYSNCRGRSRRALAALVVRRDGRLPLNLNVCAHKGVTGRKDARSSTSCVDSVGEYPANGASGLRRERDRCISHLDTHIHLYVMHTYSCVCTNAPNIVYKVSRIKHVCYLDSARISRRKWLFHKGSSEFTRVHVRVHTRVTYLRDYEQASLIAISAIGF